MYGVALFFAATTIVMHFSRPTVQDFCTGSKDVNLRSIRFRGQGREAVLLDKASLKYLSTLFRLDTLPTRYDSPGGFSYDATLSDGWGRLGTIDTLFGDSHRDIRLEWVDFGFYGEDHFRFIVMDAAAPEKLVNLRSFLLSTNPPGRLWVDGVIHVK